MIFSPIEHDRTARAVERQIEMLVLEGVLRTGEKLPGERELSKNFNVSRPIVRQALESLEQRGLLITRHGGGTFVADVIGTIFAEPVVDLIGQNEKAKADYLEYRCEMESIAASLAAQRATEADRMLLSELVQQMKKAHNEGDAAAEAQIDLQFHNAIVDCAHNIILLHTLRSCYRLLADDVFFNRQTIYDRPGMRENLLKQHLAIFDAIMARDPEAAKQAAVAHINFVIDVTKDVKQAQARETVSTLRLEKAGLK